MAIPGEFGEIGRTVLGKIISGSVMIVGTLLLIVIIGVVMYFIFYLRKFNIKVRIKTKRGAGSGGNPIYKIYYDKGGILTKKKKSFFRVLRERIDLPCPPYEALQISSKGGNEIEIIQEGENQYYYCIPGAITGDIGKIRSQEYYTITAGNPFWDDVRGREVKRKFDPESLLWKIAPIALAVFMIMGVVFYTYIWLDKAPAIIEAGKAVAEELKETAAILKEITTAKTAVG